MRRLMTEILSEKYVVIGDLVVMRTSESVLAQT
jgi:hypothetical protein